MNSVFCMLLVLGLYRDASIMCWISFFSTGLFLKVRVDRRVRRSSRSCLCVGICFLFIGLMCCCDMLEWSIAFVGHMSRHCPHETQTDSLVMVGVVWFLLVWNIFQGQTWVQ